jgi:hypothetical protein
VTGSLDLARVTFLGVAALGIVAIAVIWILRRRLLGAEAKAHWENSRPAPLTPDEFHRLQQWQRRMRWVALGTLFYLGAMVGFTSALPAEARLLRGLAFLILPVLILAGVVLQFSVRCPRCELPLGLQSSLGVPPDCERCGVRLLAPKPQAPRR